MSTDPAIKALFISSHLCPVRGGTLLVQGQVEHGRVEQGRGALVANLSCM